MSESTLHAEHDATVPVGEDRPSPARDARGEAGSTAFLDASLADASLGKPSRTRVVRRLLVAGDLLAIAIAIAVATSPLFGADMEAPLALTLVAAGAFLVVALVLGLYDADSARVDHSTADELGRILNATTLATWGAVACFALAGAEVNLPRTASFWLTFVAIVPLARVGARVLAKRSSSYYENAIVVGAGDVGQLLAYKLAQHRDYGIRVVGFVDDAPKEPRSELHEPILLGSPSRLPQLIDEYDVGRVFIAFSRDSHENVLELLRSLDGTGVRVDLVPRLFEMISSRLELHSVEGLPLMALPGARLSRSARVVKRVFDLTFAVIGVVLLSPLLLALALLIRLDSPGPVIFRQLRVGADDKSFSIIKFRTMAVDADDRKSEVAHLNWHARTGGDSRMFKIPDDPRVTRIGGFLRRYSLDELPQLINVIRGEMTLVGPRPLIVEEDEQVPKWARRRLALKPGMTGLWQSLGGSSIPFGEMVRLDYLYVATWSPWNDLRLILRTLPMLASSRHVS